MNTKLPLLLENDIVEFFRKIFETGDFMARWQCGYWSGFHGWAYIIADLMIFSAYFAIPALIYYFLRKKATIKFKKLGILFILFIFFCGSTHLLDAIIFWVPLYRFNGFLLICTAIVSWITVFSLLKVLPVAFSMKTTDELESIISKRTYEITHRKRNLEDFSQIVSHNLRAPLASLQSLVDVYDLKDDSASKDDQIKKVKEVLVKMNTSIDNVSEVVNWQLGEFQNEYVKIGEILNSVKETLKASIDLSNAKISFKSNVKRPIFYPKIYIESIFINLISNSIKYKKSNESPKIQIDIAPESKGSKDIVMVFKDNGIGIDLNKYGHKIFELNQTFHEHKDARGIGLYLVKRHIVQLGGKIDVKSEVNTGTTFTILLKDQTE